ncbi:TPA: DNA recombination protein RmuC [Flavobacterium psychrophilum]|uniref:DNA recombination protein RmuC n=1 Tax=Flavobacterium psychrophilum TaxID=96345 RepID=UPI00073F25CB|nr:DNA recombination protein RmuC [Flavobacterium psychrophilum]SNB97245.1 DNA recombination protein RmuC homolog [Flavobacterium psychrophilum]GAQ49296.1 DNA recombination protein RmuC [Flavobacterium psychrophilum]GAW89884.1 DNA recombination protein RmuC [Flavobacterium psychrophilum]GEJ32879.1 DNA recombination protein RmuC [Flavobacterium psychrophilum]GEJ35974.1 DNA recombination protein RmuC [Flavobacterium psychrophilum]
MSEVLVLASFIIALFIGIFIGKIIFTAKFQSEKNVFEEKLNALKEQSQIEKSSFDKVLLQLNTEKEQIRTEKEVANIQLAKKEADFDSLLEKNKDQKQEVEQLQEKFTKEFENLANKILEEKTNKFTEQNKENMKNILTPLQDKILHFEKKVEDTHKESIDYHAALRQQILGLSEMNAQMSKETLNLTKALKGDSKMQGNWGELVLERVLEKSGLEKGREYIVQQSFTTAEGNRVFPDVVINLPDGKKMIVDSKVSLTAYEKYINEEDDILKSGYLKEHINSIKRHVEQLGDKNYHDLYQMESPDFVLLFIPIEPAFALALNEDTTLYNKAFEKNIVIVTPSTLLATLRTIDSMWANQKQQENALEIARQAGALYDKFEGFVADLIKIGKKIDESKVEYSGAMNKLIEGKGNLVTSVEKLKKMGAKAKKSLPESIINRAEANENNLLN